MSQPPVRRSPARHLSKPGETRVPALSDGGRDFTPFQKHVEQSRPL